MRQSSPTDNLQKYAEYILLMGISVRFYHGPTISIGSL